MSKTISWEVDASDAIGLIDRMMRAMVSYEEPLSEGSRFLKTKFGANFDSQGSMVGGWPALAPRTAEWRAANGYPPTNPILVNEGGLRAAVFGARTVVNNKDATVNVQHRVAPFHQYGSTKVNLPAREIVFVPTGFAELMARRLGGHIIPARMTAELRNLFQR